MDSSWKDIKPGDLVSISERGMNNWTQRRNNIWIVLRVSKFDKNWRKIVNVINGQSDIIHPCFLIKLQKGVNC